MSVLYSDAAAPSISISRDQQQDVRDSGDDWTGTSDPAKRRKIQNRLHQRAWRRRNAVRRKTEVAGKDGGVAIRPTRTDHEQADMTVSQSPQVPSDGWVGLGDVDKTRQSLARFATYAHARYAEGSPRTDLLFTLIKFNVFRALMMNGEDLRLGQTWMECEATSPFYRSQERISAAVRSSPSNLKPTPLQLTVDHHPWIDLLPSPTLRNNILEQGDDYDDGFLCHDVVDNRHGDQSESLIVWGNPCNVESWEIGEDFYRKWAPILRGCHDLFRATNYWRGIRGERRLFRNELGES